MILAYTEYRKNGWMLCQMNADKAGTLNMLSYMMQFWYKKKKIKMSHVRYAVSREVSLGLIFKVTAACSRNHVDQQVFEDLRSRLAPNLAKYDLK